MKRITVLFLIILITLTFSGCDSEIHDRMLIRGVGIDKDGMYYKLSVRAENVTENEEELLVSKGETVFDALTSLSLKSGSRQMYADSYYIIFGKSILTDGIDKSLDFFIRYFKATPTEQLFVAQNTAEEILSIQKDNKFISSDYIKDLKNSSDNSGKTVSLSLLELLSFTKSPSKTALIPILRKDGENLSLSGAYLLKEYLPIDYLSGEDIFGIKAAKGELKTAALVFSSEEYGKVTLEINKTESQIIFLNPPYKIKIQIKAMASIASLSLNSYGEIRNIDNLEKTASEKLKEKIETSLKYYNQSADLLGLNFKLYKDYNEIYRKIIAIDNFENKYEIETETIIEIVKTGQENKN